MKKLLIGLVVLGVVAVGVKVLVLKKPALAMSPSAQVFTGPLKEFDMTAKNWAFSPSVITVKKGDHVKIKITSADVTHGFALKDYNIKVDIEPGKTQIVEFTADKEGTFDFRCSVPCGEGHREMTGSLVVQAQ